MKRILVTIFLACTLQNVSGAADAAIVIPDDVQKILDLNIRKAISGIEKNKATYYCNIHTIIKNRVADDHGFARELFTKKIEELTDEESTKLLKAGKLVTKCMHYIYKTYHL